MKLQTPTMEEIEQSLWKEQASSLALSKMLYKMSLQFEGKIDQETLTMLYGVCYMLSGVSENLLETYKRLKNE